MSKAHASRTPPLLVVVGSLLVLAASAGGVMAQGAPTGAIGPGLPPGAPPGGGFRPRLPKQGFENTGQIRSNYTPEEKAAVAVVKKWIEAITKQDTTAQMALIDDDIIFRTDPLDLLRHGARNYCAVGPGLDVPEKGTTSTIEELYVVAGKGEALVLLRRQDLSPATVRNVGLFGGYTIPFAVLLRIRNGKIVEFYDMPTNKVSQGGMPFPQGALPAGPPRAEPARCLKYTNGSTNHAAAPVKPALSDAGVPAEISNDQFGTSKPEYLFNPYEESAAQTVRSWFAASEAADPLLLGAFVDRNVTFRASPTDSLGHGRDNLLRQVCGSMGGKRRLIDLFVIGGDYDSSVLARWDQTDDQREVTHMASFFRVQNGLITEWMYDIPLDTAQGPSNGPGGSSAACQAVDAALH